VERAARAAESDSAGLPVGVQVVARHWREDVLLAVMAALERHFEKVPDYPVESYPRRV
jgi:fatty acid amide hydrolase